MKVATVYLRNGAQIVFLDHDPGEADALVGTEGRTVLWGVIGLTPRERWRREYRWLRLTRSLG